MPYPYPFREISGFGGAVYPEEVGILFLFGGGLRRLALLPGGLPGLGRGGFLRLRILVVYFLALFLDGYAAEPIGERQLRGVINLVGQAA